jgi:branched-subunit amino acid aminotransferase/4-amino-4-deoxychorismate lyase
VWDTAQREAGPDAQALLALADGTVVDGATASVWVRRGDALLTPPAPPAVAGVAREAVFDLAAGCGYAASEATLTIADLDAADEVFFTNAVAGVVPVRGRGGDAARALTAAFEREFGFPPSGV